uniref:Uncharacterized protein n=1 Tax=Wuchereria bancrofti TaxID=6293 RepID=A0A1I8EYB6_WUCBA
MGRVIDEKKKSYVELYHFQWFWISVQLNCCANETVYKWKGSGPSITLRFHQIPLSHSWKFLIAVTVQRFWTTQSICYEQILKY